MIGKAFEVVYEMKYPPNCEIQSMQWKINLSFSNILSASGYEHDKVTTDSSFSFHLSCQNADQPVKCTGKKPPFICFSVNISA